MSEEVPSPPPNRRTSRRQPPPATGTDGDVGVQRPPKRRKVNKTGVDILKSERFTRCHNVMYQQLLSQRSLLDITPNLTRAVPFMHVCSANAIQRQYTGDITVYRLMNTLTKSAEGDPFIIRAIDRHNICMLPFVCVGTLHTDGYVLQTLKPSADLEPFLMLPHIDEVKYGRPYNLGQQHWVKTTGASQDGVLTGCVISKLSFPTTLFGRGVRGKLTSLAAAAANLSPTARGAVSEQLLRFNIALFAKNACLRDVNEGYFLVFASADVPKLYFHAYHRLMCFNDNKPFNLMNPFCNHLSKASLEQPLNCPGLDVELSWPRSDLQWLSDGFVEMPTPSNTDKCVFDSRVRRISCMSRAVANNIAGLISMLLALRTGVNPNTIVNEPRAVGAVCGDDPARPCTITTVNLVQCGGRMDVFQAVHRLVCATLVPQLLDCVRNSELATLLELCTGELKTVLEQLLQPR